MNDIPSPCVIDTNVPMTASQKSDASEECVRACVAAIGKVMASGCLALDNQWRIINEYRRNLSSTGQPSVGDRFLLWVLQNHMNPRRCVRVPITPRRSDRDNFEEFPEHPGLDDFDPSDRKFVAVAAAHQDHPPILQAVDSKWWGWNSALADCGIRVVFLCADEIAAKYNEKIGR